MREQPEKIQARTAFKVYDRQDTIAVLKPVELSSQLGAGHLGIFSGCFYYQLLKLVSLKGQSHQLLVSLW